ncbi:MAG: hypothetical protein GXY55_14885 [Phycisphaerae bacterium]|nr:hypothetical protein [Phycisphaerae bacterium]
MVLRGIDVLSIIRLAKDYGLDTWEFYFVVWRDGATGKIDPHPSPEDVEAGQGNWMIDEENTYHLGEADRHIPNGDASKLADALELALNDVSDEWMKSGGYDFELADRAEHNEADRQTLRDWDMAYWSGPCGKAILRGIIDLLRGGCCYFTSDLHCA